MLRLPHELRIANAAAVLHGSHGAVAPHASQLGLSRQARYRDAQAVLHTLAGHPSRPPLQPLRDAVGALPCRVAEFQDVLGGAFVLDDDRCANVASTARPKASAPQGIAAWPLPAAVVTAHSLRWQIEQFFKECKGALGLDRYRFREFVKVENWVQACLVSFVYLERYRVLPVGRHDLTELEKKWWRWQRSYGIGRALVQQAEEADLAQRYRWSATPSGQRKLRQSLPLEYRRAG